MYKRGVYAGAGVATIPGQSKFALYPNPTSERINVAWQNAAAQSNILSILNMEGQEVYGITLAPNEDHTTINISMLPDGVYTCVLQNATGRRYEKFSVVR